MDSSSLFNGWPALVRVLVVGILAYASLVVLLRVSGKRTLSRMNAFDLVVTVALGSTLATVLLSRSVALADGILAFGVLIFLQYGITWLSVRSDAVQHLVKAQPALLFHKGVFQDGAMKRERVTREEILAAIRQQSMSAVEDVEAVVLETDGSMTVLQRSSGKDSSLVNVRMLQNADEPSLPPHGASPRGAAG